jgi:hypothetical protein
LITRNIQQLFFGVLPTATPSSLETCLGRFLTVNG